ncbi:MULTISPECIES: RodZ domain-containing protein [unclassified Undibacterium]|uniref:RodZ domain-containing protein n=1 Tax=unclassified Undibacterium TaxID=2630295 RepID=UPI002AC9D268|nr:MULTISPECIES: RodZ domain-containing protein [unclassified Undibacterium]MEB0138360.1 DUF4115 domain-containing protein [Undibacterium sp. CCC2.1]MEB0172737.1 DUF4115 domain-containing protein [Undibacterium sp. CCC1.1]MEB0174735.1 DUF4115 domain-containing protein [Undibacterium sp. CCC3.4]MEB0213932.1 DUF4115 domain-containing protein [Undibacterium sp. 5I2]WPX42656.1 DUF4115 domain-containing protein [Undibacterium sp. CCC3.4]
MSEVGVNTPSESQLPDSDGTAVNPAAVAASAGAMLLAARVAGAWTVEQVADQLKLSPRQIIAIETNDFPLLPNMVIVRGFMRSYAKLLKIDAAPVIALLPAESSSGAFVTDLRPTLATPFMESRSPFLGRSDATNRRYLYGAAMLAAAVLVFLLAQKLEQSGYFQRWLTPSETAASVAVEEGSAPHENSVAASETAPSTPGMGLNVPLASSLPAAQTNPSSTVAAPTPASAPAAVSATVAAPAPVLPAAPVSAVQAAPSSNAALAGVVATAQQKNQLRLKFRQDSWVQVKKESGQILTSHLAKAGTEEFFDLREPVQLRLGNASGVDAWLRGSVLEMTPPVGVNTVNLSLK